ncbi:hypothetical protein [Streptomyces sp. enrichment culture]|uniref:hypothetical protein n=1 Tax=Streptomyces sp. enrichment culture TaxID=1795815 RepID=UPI003F580016
MRAWLGARISGLLIAGSLAVSLTVALGGAPAGPDPGAGIPEAAPDSTPGRSTAETAVPLPGTGAGGRTSPDGGRRSVAPGPEVPRPRPAAPPPVRPEPAAPPARPLAAPVWLPAGPRSPDTDGVADPASVYDLLRTPDRCAEVLRAGADSRGAGTGAGPDAEWRVLGALARACLAVRGAGGGDWAEAAREHAALAGRPLGCKGRAAYAVLGRLLEFHARHPGATVRPVSPSRGGAACDFRVVSVDVGGDGEARPGEAVTAELDGVFFDPEEFLREGEVSVGGIPVTDPAVPGPLVAETGPGGRLTLAFRVPAGTPAAPAVALSVGYADVRAVRERAFAVVEPPAPAAPSPSGTGTGPAA